MKSKKVKKLSKKILRLCKKLKIKVSRKSKSGKRVLKSLKQLKKEIKTKKRNLKKGKVLFIQKANKRSVKKGTIGAFRKWCKSKKLVSKSNGKVTMKCIKKGLKDKSLTIRRRANYAKNIKGYTKRSAFGSKKPNSFGNTKLTSFGSKKPRSGLSFGIDQARFDRYQQLNWEVPRGDYTKRTYQKVRRNCEDGEGSILNHPIIPGMYVNLGHKKCLSIQDVLGMSTGNGFTRLGGVLVNPFTRKPLTGRQIIKINDILRALHRPLINNPVVPQPIQQPIQQPYQIPFVPPNLFPNVPYYPDYDDRDREEYDQDVVNAMISGNLTEPELKEAFARLAESTDDVRGLADRVWDTPRGVLWRIHNGKLQFNRNVVFPPGSEWMDMQEIYDDIIINHLHHLIN